MGDVIRGIRAVMGSSWKASRGRLLISALLMLCGNVSGPLVGVFLAMTTDAVSTGRTNTVVVTAAAIAVAALLSLTMEHFAHIFFFELADLHHLRVEEQLGNHLQGTVGMEQHERQDYADKLELLRKETGSIGQGVQTVLASGALLVQIILTGFLLGRLEPWLLLLPLFAVPPLLAGRFAEARLDRAEAATAEATRLSWHLLELAVSPTAAKEMRIFNLQRLLRRRQYDLRRQVGRELQRAELRGLLLRLGGQLVFAVGYVVAVVLIVRAAVAGQRSVGDVALVVALAVQTNAQAAQALALAKSLQRNARAMSWLRWLAREAAPTPAAVPADLAPPRVLHAGIDLHGVAFRYPGTNRDILVDVTMRIPAGASVAIVGDNGAGKSTLVKLLCRFYEPTAGWIAVDGVDLRRIDVQRWRDRTAACFQDFLQLEAPAWESIGVGDRFRAHQPEAIHAAVRRADAEAVIARLPRGLESHLGKAYEDGEQLSGGQWQRVALSRAMMRDAPLLLLLDEPTSALDPLTEHALFERYAEAAREVGRRTGSITVFVSHRFSTVRMADVILVVSDGRIAEAGDHDTLMAYGGIYAELFGLQAQAYR